MVPCRGALATHSNILAWKTRWTVWKSRKTGHQKMNPTHPPAKGRKVSNTLLVWWLDGITNWMDMSLSKLQQRVEDRGVWSARVHGVRKSQTRLGYLLNSSSRRQPQVQIKCTHDKDAGQDSGVPSLLCSFGLLFGCLLGLDINPDQMSLARHNL